MLFYFDDFLGRIELDRQALLQRESSLAVFVRRVQAVKNIRFILTTRAHIFEEARQLSDHLDDARFQLAKYILDVGSFTRRVRAYILFNHLWASKLTADHCAALLENEWLKKIIDHKNYNPRAIASASSQSLDCVEPSRYPHYLYEVLESPERIWSKPYQRLNMKSQNLIVALFFGWEYGQRIEELRTNFTTLHRVVCAHYGQPARPADFEEALSALETGFLSIAGQRVSFINPSLRDFLRTHLTNQEFLLLLPCAARRADWAREVWHHVKSVFGSDPAVIAEFAQAFAVFAPRIDATPAMKRERHDGQERYVFDDLSMSDRVELLLEWWEASSDDIFIKNALELMQKSTLRPITWQDGRTWPRIHRWIRDSTANADGRKEELLRAVEERLREVVEAGPSIDELINIIKQVDDDMEDVVPIGVQEALDTAICFELDEAEYAIARPDTEESLAEHLEYIDILAELTGRDAKAAKSIVASRLAEVEEPEQDEYRPSGAGRRNVEHERFSDEAIQSLFSRLVY